MFSIANLLDAAKAKANIESDYRLAKAIGITHQAMSAYRAGKTLPNAQVIDQLCALSGDDAGLIAAQVEAARAADGPVRMMWLSVAKRLQGGATTAILSVCFAISLLALPSDYARASTVDAHYSSKVPVVQIVLNAFLTVAHFLMVRLRQFAGFFWLCRALAW